MTNLNIASVHDRRGPYYADRNKTCCHLEGLIPITYRPPRDTCSLLNYDSMWRPLYRCQSINMTKGIVLDSRYTGTLTCILQNGHSYTCPQIPGWHEGGETSSRHLRDIQLENATGPYTTPNEGEIATNMDLHSGISTGDIIKTFSTETHAGIHIISWTRHFLLDSHDHTLDVCLSYDHSLGTYIYKTVHILYVCGNRVHSNLFNMINVHISVIWWRSMLTSNTTLKYRCGYILKAVSKHIILYHIIKYNTVKPLEMCERCYASLRYIYISDDGTPNFICHPNSAVTDPRTHRKNGSG